jgi:hypothetical protein
MRGSEREWCIMSVRARMSRIVWILWTSAVGACVLGCSSAAPADGGVTTGHGSGTGSGSAGATMGVSSSATFGQACVPSSELDPTFQGFSVDDVSVESNAPTCSSSAPVCLINHFQGRTTCPFGQTAPGVGPEGSPGSPAASFSSEDGCILPGEEAGKTSSQVTATDVAIPGYGAGTVPPQIVGAGASNRTASSSVYCSCRCANANGTTNDGATYCACPSNSTCTQLVTSVGGADDAISGAYCVLNGTEYNPALATSSTCSATVSNGSEPGFCSVEY